LTKGMAIWAGTVTILLIVIVALVFRRLRRTKWSDSASTYSDAESAISISSKKGFDSCSIVDVDMIGHDLEKGRHNDAFDNYECSSASMCNTQQRRDLPKGLDTELDENTVEALANLPEDPDLPEVHTVKTSGDGSGLTGRHYRMAPYSLKIQGTPPGSSAL